MEKKIEDYLHLYIPFEFEWIVDAVPFNKGERGIMTAKDLQFWDEYKKPILRPLSSMTEEEKGAYIKFEYPSFDEVDPNPFEDLIGIILCNKCRPDQFYYLLSKGFDLFGLIESGLAVEKIKPCLGRKH